MSLLGINSNLTYTSVAPLKYSQAYLMLLSPWRTKVLIITCNHHVHDGDGGILLTRLDVDSVMQNIHSLFAPECVFQLWLLNKAITW